MDKKVDEVEEDKKSGERRIETKIKNSKEKIRKTKEGIDKKVDEEEVEERKRRKREKQN